MRRLRPALVVLLVALAAVAASPIRARSPSRQDEPAAGTETIDVNAQAPGHPFPHFWERMFGSGRAILSLRASYRRDLRAVKAVTGFEYVRFHAIFHDEVGVYDEDAGGRPVYNFSYVDQIYDGLLAAGVRPYVELSFMPRKLAGAPIFHSFWYRPIVSPPKDWTRWGDLVRRFATHLVDRYGIDEVSRWYFEVWNEPNIDFWAGTPKQETYFRLYDTSAEALKRVNPSLRVGGPATAQAAWITPFIRHAADRRVPLDFVSTHVYGNDTPQNVFGAPAGVHVSRADMVGRAVRKVHDEVASSPRPELPIIWSEYNASYLTEPGVTDAPYMGPWLANTIRESDGLADILSYWTFSDVFEEQGVVKQPFYGGYGLIAERGLPKPAFNAFELLHRLGTRRLPAASTSALVTRRDDGTLAIALWNLVDPGAGGAARRFAIVVHGARQQASISRVDADHGSALKTYAALGRPRDPTRAQIEALRRAAELPPPHIEPLQAGRLTVTVPPHGLVVVEIR